MMPYLGGGKLYSNPTTYATTILGKTAKKPKKNIDQNEVLANSPIDK